METWKQSNIVFDGKVVRLRIGSVLLDNGDEAYREVVEHPGGVCVLPFTGDAFVLVRQYRIALGHYIIEAPAGKLEPGEAPMECARKELHEETGYKESDLISLGTIYPSVGFCNEKIHLFLAVGLIEIGSKPEPEERIEIITMSPEEVRRKLAQHQFQDSKTHVILDRALHYLSHQQ